MTENKNEELQEMQVLDQNLHNLLLQKQAFQMELSESKDALKELGNSKDEVFKIIGQLMIKSEKSKMQEEILNKIKIFELKMKNLEKQEASLANRIEKIRDNGLKA